MVVHFKIARHGAAVIDQSKTLYSIHNDEHLLRKSWGAKDDKNGIGELLQSCFPLREDFSCIAPCSNGFVDTVVKAYSMHHSLVIRPDDVWIAILCQFNFYVNAHAEDLRSSFVAHEGKKELIVRAEGNRYTVNFGDMATQMTEQIEANVVDKSLKDWILPDFTTTTPNDTVVAAVLMMATLKAYFEYVFSIDCGLPSVTLDGTKDDWVKILSRINKLEEYGEEPMAWAGMLRSILRRFVGAFDGEIDHDFWNQVCHHHPLGSGTTYISGWITAFCVWTCEGRWNGPSLAKNTKPRPDALVLDGVQYPFTDLYNIPVGFCEVDVKLIDNGDQFDSMMVAGHVGSLAEGEDKVLDTLRPVAGWFMFIKAGKVPGGAKLGIRRENNSATGTSYKPRLWTPFAWLRWLKKKLRPRKLRLL